MVTYTYSDKRANEAKRKSQNGYFKKAKHAKISEKQTFLTP